MPSLFPLRTESLSLQIGSQTLLNQIDLEITEQGLTVIMGANGAGKSLLIRTLHGLLAHTSGQIRWHSQPMSPVIRRRQAMIFQRPVLLRRSVAANIDFALAQRSEKSAARRNQLLDDVGLSALARRPARLLSGGEQQRLALARALATQPEVLFLDEPTANLDPASILALEKIIQSLTNTKVIYITHDLGQARRLADDIVFLHAGKLLEHTDAAQFFCQPESAAARAYLDGRIFI